MEFQCKLGHKWYAEPYSIRYKWCKICEDYKRQKDAVKLVVVEMMRKTYQEEHGDEDDIEGGYKTK